MQRFRSAIPPKIRLPLLRPVERQYLDEEALDLAFRRMLRLPEMELLVIILTFGLLGLPAWPVSRIASKFGVTPQCIYQITERALGRLRDGLDSG